ncbi:hypothetical protein SCHPADRAFT_644821 [Schizopora paradoxa]|uniref:Uncharacterized protein n=1 Tax=Schizopora paradoxa TaxID=27342 RepID=A0A0H2R824_9AGAM|nr:hypothetical protein SCHPADRAFT_644821 [Schizopora paradoxa]
MVSSLFSNSKHLPTLHPSANALSRTVRRFKRGSNAQHDNFKSSREADRSRFVIMYTKFSANIIAILPPEANINTRSSIYYFASI